MQSASNRSKSQQQRAGRILVVGIVLDDLGFCSRVADFLLADVPLNDAAKRVPAVVVWACRVPGKADVGEVGPSSR